MLFPVLLAVLDKYYVPKWNCICCCRVLSVLYPVKNVISYWHLGLNWQKYYNNNKLHGAESFLKPLKTSTILEQTVVNKITQHSPKTFTTITQQNFIKVFQR